MKTPLNAFPAPHRSVMLAAMACATLTLASRAATVLTGDHEIAANLSASPAEAGDLTVAGNFAAGGGIDFGKLPSAPGQYGAMMTYDPVSRSALLDLTESDASYLWRQDTDGGTAKSKMTLSGINSLSLFKADGSVPGITLDPNSGSITLAGLSSGIYNSLGNAVLSINSNGQLSFPTKPLFSNGLDFGSAGSLDTGKISYLQSLLTNMGYQENPVVSTPISQLDISGVNNLQVAQAPAGEIFIAGDYYGGARVGWYSLGGNGAFVARLYANGNVRWLKKLNTTGSVGNLKLAAHPSGGLAIAGYFYTDVSVQYSPLTLTSAGQSDGFAFKLSPDNGNVIWEKSIGGTSYDYAQSLALSPSGDLTLGGTFHGTLLDENGATSLTSAGGSDAFVTKLSAANGTRLWTQRIGGPSSESIYGLAADSSGNVYATGTFDGTASINGTSATLVSAGGQDAFIVKLASADGSLAWKKRIGGTSWDSAVAIATDSVGNPVVIGTIYGNATDGNDGIALNGAGSQDGFLFKLSPTDGSFTWGTRLGGASHDNASALAIDPADNILVGGYFYGTMTAINGGTPVTSKGYYDSYLAKFSSTGTALLLQPIGGENYDSLYTLGTANSRVYLSGYAGTSFRIGDTVIPQESYNLHWNGSPIVTSEAPPAQSFSWNGGIASGTNSFASGNTSMASGQGSTAFGGGVATGQNSFATGGAKAGQSNSFAHGSGSEASGYGSIAIGSWNKATGQNSVAIGSGLKAANYGSVALGSYNAGITSENWGLQSIFELGNGSSSFNAITTLRNGQTTLTNQGWKWNPTNPLGEPQWSPASYSHGEALVVEGHTRLKGKVIIEQAQGDISMGIYQ